MLATAAGVATAAKADGEGMAAAVHDGATDDADIYNDAAVDAVAAAAVGGGAEAAEWAARVDGSSGSAAVELRESAPAAPVSAAMEVSNENCVGGGGGKFGDGGAKSGEGGAPSDGGGKSGDGGGKSGDGGGKSGEGGPAHPPADADSDERDMADGGGKFGDGGAKSGEGGGSGACAGKMRVRGNAYAIKQTAKMSDTPQLAKSTSCTCKQKKARILV